MSDSPPLRNGADADADAGSRPKGTHMHAAPRDETTRRHAGNTRAAASAAPVTTDVVRACAHTGWTTAAQRVHPLTANCAGAVSIGERFVL